ncbi:MAG: hypothetical protein K0R24_234 [Gammaproteobacteria bacterium]|jgi:opacity protein-like surface antigen|nr:hypothetical protein [Gammaproteobacteria bacterium]
MKAKTIMKFNAAIASSLLLTTVANAAVVGLYEGIGLGESAITMDNPFKKNSTSDFPYTNTTTQNRGLAGKLFAGYNFNQYVGLELSYGIYAKRTDKGTFIEEDYYSISISNESFQHEISALSLVGKAYLPIQQTFNVYALGGISEVFQTLKYTSYKFEEDAYHMLSYPTSSSKTKHALRPIYGIGASYDVNTRVTTGLEFSRIQGRGNTNTSPTAIPSANLLTLTAAYNFG